MMFLDPVSVGIPAETLSNADLKLELNNYGKSSSVTIESNHGPVTTASGKFPVSC